MLVSPDGNNAFVIRTRTKSGAVSQEYYQDIPVTNHIIDLNTGADRKVLIGVRQVSGGGWSFDSRTFFAADDYSDDERLVELGMVDENKLGTMGWSNGGMISNALIAQDQRFKAASCGAGGAEWVSLWGPCVYGDGNVEYYFGADPISDPGLFTQPAQAPFYDAKKVKTPVIMFGGSQDAAVPIGMTWITYRGIQKYARVPVELYIFPGEPHVLESPVHQLRKITEELKWFDKYLFQRGK
jgi:dipeptidyl aminopeptidase/acylaminoacyl peptidase